MSYCTYCNFIDKGIFEVCPICAHEIKYDVQFESDELIQRSNQ